jgi:hypothetical protein
MNHPTAEKLIAGSCRCYLLLLQGCQPDFRRRYGQEMGQVFRDRSRNIQQRGGFAGLLWWWGEALVDLADTAVTTRLVALEQGDWDVKRMLRIAAQITLGVSGMILCFYPLVKRPMPYWNAGIYLCCAIALLSAALGLTWAATFRAQRTKSENKEAVCLKL